MEREWLIRARIKKGLSRMQLAEQLGLSKDHYSQIEDGTAQQHMDLALVQRLSAALGLTVGQIMDDEDGKLTDRVTVKEAAKLMGVSEQFIRIGLQRGELPIGSCVKMSSKWTYHISRSRLNAYLEGR